MTNSKTSRGVSARKALVETAKASPTAVFDGPNEVVSSAELTIKEKTGILTQWEDDAIALQKATDEGMSGGKRPRLDEVKNAQTLLGAKTATISADAQNVTLINTFDVAPEKSDELIAALIEGTEKSIRNCPGFVSANFHKSDDGRRVVNYAQWASRADIKAMQADPKVQAHMKNCAAIATRSDPVIYDVISAA